MATTVAQETICALDGNPIDRGSSAFLKAVDKLLTVGAYYSTDHSQYRTVSEEVCSQVLESMNGAPSIALEITAKGMVIRSQVIDPNHRNVRLLHDLLVPLNIARLEFKSGLTPVDLRLAIDVLQNRRLNLGSTSGFQEILIEGLPDTVNTAGKKVVRGEGGGEEGLTLEELLAPFAGADTSPGDDEVQTEGERLARHFLDLVNSILENLERSLAEAGQGEDGPSPDTAPENIKALKEALRRLVEINPDPRDLARLIEHAKRALDLSRDPGSVDLVFSLLKKEASQGEDWRNRKASGPGEKREYRLTVEALVKETDRLAMAEDPETNPEETATLDHLGICFHLLEIDPTDSVENAIVQALDNVLSRSDVTEKSLRLCFSAMGTAAARDGVEIIDRLFPAFCEPLRKSRPRALATFWVKLWDFLSEDRRALVWPHLVNDLMNGLAGIPKGVLAGLWRASGTLAPRSAVQQVPRLEKLSAWTAKVFPSSLLSLPVEAVFPVFLCVMKSSLAPIGGPRLHYQLGKQVKSPLTITILKATGDYDSTFDPVYLALAAQGDSSRFSARTKTLAFRTLADALDSLHPAMRNSEWVMDAINWMGRLDPEAAHALLTRIRDERKWILFRAWPVEAREASAEVLARIDRRSNGEGES